MAIDRVAIPTPTAPVALADYQAQLDQITALNQAFSGRNIVDGSTIHAGCVMMIGGVLYKSTTDTAITGTPSKFVKITPSGATASAAFVPSLSGVSWNHAYGGYYDGTGNLYLFDEARAVNDGDISTAYTLQGQIAYLKGGLDINGALSGVTSISASGAISGASIGVSGAVTGASANISGAISGASIGVSGAVTGASSSISGDANATRHISSGYAYSRGAALAPHPSTTGIGQWTIIDPGFGLSYTLPAGGTWAYFATLYGSSGYPASVCNIAGGGNTICSTPSGTQKWLGFAWRYD